MLFLDYNLVVLTFAVAFVVSMMIAPGVIRLLKRLKIGQTIQVDGPESHKSKAGTPTMGGIIIILGILIGVPTALYSAGKTSLHEFFYPECFRYLMALLILVLSYAFVGLVDDYLTIKPVRGIRGISSKPKAALQLLIAAGFVLWLRQAGFDPVLNVAGKHFFLGEAYWVLATFFIAGMSNFVNITDGLDGLVSGLVLILVPVLVWCGLPPSGDLIIGFTTWPFVLTPLLVATSGACLAFLWYNANPAKVFMGDTGSLALGALLSASAIVTHREVLLIVIGMVFILDGLSTALQWAVFKYTRIRTGTGRRVFLKSPVHHHFEMLGWPEQKVVVRFWICGVIAAVLGFAGAAMGWW
ncbi:MAG: phospho-N-acetylmuramoyl-pentapeptide-transferase [Armatimonadota bacterium]|nr:phospho-N-acetylmuramoyl-pentapeptide-transferase [bacterium]